MGLLDHYRQYEALSDEEVSVQLRAEADERRRRALARIDPLDLSGTAWFEPPHPDVVAAITYPARRAFNRYADPRAGELRREPGLVAPAQRSAVEPARLVDVGRPVSCHRPCGPNRPGADAPARAAAGATAD